MLWRLARSEAKREVNRKWALFSVKNLLLPTCQLFLCNLFYSFLQRGEFSLHTFKTLQPIGSSFKSSVALQHTIADQFVPEKYPNYGNFMICNNVKRLTSNNYIEEEGEFKHQFTGLLVPTKLTALYIFYTSLS